MTIYFFYNKCICVYMISLSGRETKGFDGLLPQLRLWI